MDKDKLRALMHGSVDAELENVQKAIPFTFEESEVFELLIGRICHLVCEKVVNEVLMEWVEGETR